MFPPSAVSIRPGTLDYREEHILSNVLMEHTRVLQENAIIRFPTKISIYATAIVILFTLFSLFQVKIQTLKSRTLLIKYWNYKSI